MVGYLPPLPGTDEWRGKRFPTQQLIHRDKREIQAPRNLNWVGWCQSVGNIWLKTPSQGYLEQGWGSHACGGGGKKDQIQLEETESWDHVASWEQAVALILSFPKRPNPAGRNRIMRPRGLLRAGSGLDSQLPSSVLVPSQTWLHALPWVLRVTVISFQKSLPFVQWCLNQKTCSHFRGTEF